MRAVAGSAGEKPARPNPTFDEANDVRVARGRVPKLSAPFVNAAKKCAATSAGMPPARQSR